MPEVSYDTAEDVATIGSALIADEDEFSHLRDAVILYVFSDIAPKRNGVPIFSSTDVVRGKNAFLYWKGRNEPGSRPFYRVMVSEDLWQRLDGEQSKFLVRHALRHCGVKNNKKGRRLVVTPHDVDLFLSDLTDTCWESVCAVWQKIQEAEETGQAQLPLPGTE